MKKIIFGSAAAICAAVGFSSFKSASKATTTYYWFKVVTAETKAPTPLPALQNSDLDESIGFYASTTSPTPPASPCSGGSFYCLAGFSSAQMSANLGGINTVHGKITPALNGAYSRN